MIFVEDFFGAMITLSRVRTRRKLGAERLRKSADPEVERLTRTGPQDVTPIAGPRLDGTRK
jgi:hypothetical protein